jgi:hypothetical protein
MANFQYSGITLAIRQPTVEGLLEDIPNVLAEKIADLAGITDVGNDGDFDVTNDVKYERLMTQTMVMIKKKLK